MKHALILSAVTLILSGCLAGPNALIVPVTHKGMELAGYAVDAAFSGPQEPQEPISVDELLAQAEQTCVEHQLSEADCTRLKEETERMGRFALRIQGIEEVAQTERERQRREALKPGNIVRDLALGAVNQQLMFGQASVAGTMVP